MSTACTKHKDPGPRIDKIQMQFWDWERWERENFVGNPSRGGGKIQITAFAIKHAYRTTRIFWHADGR